MNSVIMVPYMYVLSIKSVALREPTRVETKILNFPPKTSNSNFARFDRKKACYDHTNTLRGLIRVTTPPEVCF